MKKFQQTFVNDKNIVSVTLSIDMKLGGENLRYFPSHDLSGSENEHTIDHKIRGVIVFLLPFLC
jgi:hypothetical protein